MIAAGLVLFVSFAASSYGLDCISCVSYPMSPQPPDPFCMDDYGYRERHVQNCSLLNTTENGIGGDMDSKDVPEFACMKYKANVDGVLLISRMCVPNLEKRNSDYCDQSYDYVQYCYCFSDKCNHASATTGPIFVFLISIIMLLMEF